MFFDPGKTVREVAVAFPKVTRVFEQMNIDYCGGGDQLLGDACARAGVDLRMLAQMLEASVPAAVSAFDFRHLTLAESIKYILDTHHVYTRREMNRLQALADYLAHAHGEKHPELLSIRSLLQELFAELKSHMFREEQILFPFVIRLEESARHDRPGPFACFGTVNNPIRTMIVEHDEAGELLLELRKLSGGYRVPGDASFSYQTFYQSLEAFEEDLHQHIHLENNILFRKATDLMSYLLPQVRENVVIPTYQNMHA